MSEQTRKSQASLYAFLDMRGVPTWMQGLTLAAALVVAHEFDRHIGGWVGFFVGVSVALTLMGTVWVLWRIYRR